MNATFHYLKSHDENIEFDYFANALNPYYEEYGDDGFSISEDRFICDPKVHESWFFGSSNTGDIFNESFVDDLRLKIEEKYDTKDTRIFDFVTGDGAFDCSKNPDKQEEEVYKLIEKECWIGLNFLKDNGTMVVKFFTFFQKKTMVLVHRLFKVFGNVTAYKPSTSKAGNRETYLVCRNFNLEEFNKASYSQSDTFFNQSDPIPMDFYNVILNYCQKKR